MSHNLGPVEPVGTVITGTLNFVPPGGTPRFVMLHFDSISLGASGRLEVDLGYDTDIFTASSGSDVWTRPINPQLAPISVSVVGGSARLVEFGRAQPTITGTPGTSLGSETNPDPFLQTDPYDEPTYETRLECNAGFAWENAACPPAGSAQRRVAASVGIVFLVHDGHVSSCSGTLIGSDLFLTSRHCFTDPDRGDVRAASVTFDYQTLCSPAGGKPPGHSPQFFKVVEDVLSGGPPTGGTPSLADDWVLLRLDAAPGAMPPPVPMRDSLPMGPETVFTMHHPNGAVKKTQVGTWDGASQVSGFDFAGGSSGSALFDAAGNVIAGPLHCCSGCSVSYTALAPIIDAIENPPAPPVPLDVTVVFDKSGSMGSPAPPAGRTKLEEAQDAAALFISLVRAGAGDRLGLVTFNQSPTLDQAPGLVTAVRTPLVGVSPFDSGAVGAITSGGTTGLGAGVERALTAMSGTSNQRVILLLSDGMQNRPPLIETVESSLGDTKLCVIGFGSDADIDGPLLNRIAREHGGQFTRAVDGLTLRKFFGLCFGNIFESGELMDPNKVLRASEGMSEEIPFLVCDEERFTVILGWDQGTTPLRAHILTPNGNVISADTRVESVRGRTWAFWRVALPHDGERAGSWRIAVDRVPVGGEFPPPPTDVEYFVTVVPSGGPSLIHLNQPRRVYTGDSLRPLVALHYTDRTTPHHAQVKLHIDTPTKALGTLVSEHGLVEPAIGDDTPSPFHATLQAIAAEAGGLPIPRRTNVVDLHDDGTHEDGAMEPDGIFGDVLEGITRYEGTYDLRAFATYGDECVGTREATWSIHVEPGIDPRRTTVDLVDASSGTGTLVFSPHDTYGSPLGPGRGNRFTVNPGPGVVVTGPVKDQGDGSYGINIRWDETVTSAPGVVVSQPERDPVVLQPDDSSPTAGWCPPWVCWMLGVAVVVLLILLIIVLVT